MTVIALLNMVFGGYGMIVGLYGVTLAHAMFSSSLRMSAFSQLLHLLIVALGFSVLVLATGIIGLVAGISIFSLRPWARALSLLYGALFVVTGITSSVINNVASPDQSMVLAIATTLVIYLPYPIILYVVFYKPTWKATFTPVSAPVSSFRPRSTDTSLRTKTPSPPSGPPTPTSKKSGVGSRR